MTELKHIIPLTGTKIDEKLAQVDTLTTESELQGSAITALQNIVIGNGLHDTMQSTIAYGNRIALTKTIKAGTPFKVKLTRNTTSKTATFYGYTSSSGTEYLQLTAITKVGDERTVTASIDINYIAANDYQAHTAGESVDFAWEITSGDISGSLQKKVEVVEGDVDTLQTDVTTLKKYHQKVTVIDTPVEVKQDYYIYFTGVESYLADRNLVLAKYNVTAGVKYKIKCGTLSTTGDNILAMAMKSDGGFTVISTVGDCQGRLDTEYTVQTGETQIKLYSQTTAVADYGISHTEGGTDENIEEIKQSINNINSQLSKGKASKFRNNTVDFKKNHLRILDIGNSYTEDPTAYLNDITNAARIKAGKATMKDFLGNYSMYIAPRSSGSFKTWVNAYNGTDTTEHYVRAITDTITGGYVDSSLLGWENRTKKPIKDVLNNYEWDLILIHQVSNYANNFDVWEGTTDGGYLKQWIDILHTCQPQAAIGMTLTHSYANDRDGNTEGDHLLRWKNIANAICKAHEQYGIDFIIPYGTAVENLRMAYVNKEGYGRDMTRDGSHMANGLCKYSAACTYYEMLIGKRTGITVIGNTHRIASETTSTTGFIAVTDDNAIIAQKAAVLACEDMLTAVNAETTTCNAPIRSTVSNNNKNDYSDTDKDKVALTYNSITAERDINISESWVGGRYIDKTPLALTNGDFVTGTCSFTSSLDSPTDVITATANGTTVTKSGIYYAYSTAKKTGTITIEKNVAEALDELLLSLYTRLKFLNV